ncbi:unnamed protein product [Phaedon cochleariae]|uniref:Myb/SANT-like DNA-binding domain-containing protein n=1 Tax=Phaedon cochleariae TaxID=80249 RepID=A0A9N9SAR0_PHACE|nr:unnamed protein product [Phaedon cochleariae]
MATETITLYDSEKDLLLDVKVSPEDARRAERDISFATELLKTALQQQSSESCISEDSSMVDVSHHGSMIEDQDGEHIADTTDPDESLTEATEVSLYRWSPPCVMLLLETYRNMENTFNKGKLSHKRLWKKISAELLAKGYNVTGPQCASELRSLKKTYKATKYHNNKSGNDRRNWQFFEIMDYIFSGKAWSNPVAIASSTGLFIQTNTLNSFEGSDSGCSTNQSSTSKQTIVSLFAKRMKQKEEHEKNKADRHKEKMEMEKKWLELLQHMSNK